jgi:hypothetical protein
MLTVQGAHAVRRFSELDGTFARDWDQVAWTRDGFIYRPYSNFRVGSTDLPGIKSSKREVSYGLTFISRDYITDHWLPPGLEFINLYEGTVDNLQDVVVVRKQGEGD